MISQVFSSDKQGKPGENPDKIPINGKTALPLALLIIAGFLGNYYAIPLFFGADFLFGSVATLLVLYFYGFYWGIFAAVVANSYTYFLWGHPYGFLNFTCEVLFIGIFLKRGRGNLLVLDGLFWLMVGMPLAWIEHGIVMHMGAISTAFIMLKQAINGVFNALLVSLAICYLPLGRLLQGSRFSPKITLRESLFNLLVMMVLVPALLFTMLESKHEKQRLETGIMVELRSLSASVQFHLQSWYQLHLQAVQELSVLASRSSMTPSAQLQRETEILRRAFPDFRTMHVENAEGRSIAFEPRVNEKGESTLGLNFSDRSWFQGVKAGRQPLVSDVFKGNLAVFSPIVNLCVPIVREDRWLGCTTGTLDLKKVQEMLQPYRSEKVAILTLTDLQGRIIASTDPERKPLTLWDRKKTGLFQPLDALMYLWQPNDPKLPSMTRWKQSYYVQETQMGSDLPWKLIAESPVAPLQGILYAIYVKNLAIMACLTALALLLSHLFSGKFARPLAQLAQVTANLPEKLSEAQSLGWPTSSSREVDSLIDNFKSMAGALEVNFHKLQDQSDELRQANRGLALEVQERQQAEAALRYSEERYRSLVANATDMIFIAQDGVLKFPNPATMAFTAYSEEELTTLPFAKIIHPEHREMVIERFTKILKGEKVPNNDSFRILTNREEELWVQLNAALITWDGRPGVLCAVRDITPQKRLEAQYLHAQKMEAVGTLAGGVAHDFNNLLQSVMGNAELLLMEKNPDEPTYRPLTAIQQAAQRGADLTRQLLTFSRKVRSKRGALNLNQEIVQVENLLQRTIPKMIQVELRLAGDLWTIHADSVQIGQVIMNLAVNARDAMPEGGKLLIGTQNVTLDEEFCRRHVGSRPGRYVLLGLSDTGCGMEKEVLEHVFEPFFTTKGVGQGTGLGLAMVYGIVKDHDGYIACESKKGVGTLFNIYWPAMEKNTEVEEVENKQQPKGGKETILLVDDEPPLQDLGKTVLSKFGYAVLTAPNGERALEIYKAERDRIHLVVLDLNMPGMGGMRCLEELHCLNPAVKVAIATGYYPEEMAKGVREGERRVFISKPYNIYDLLAGVRKALDG